MCLNALENIMTTSGVSITIVLRVSKKILSVVFQLVGDICPPMQEA